MAVVKGERKEGYLQVLDKMRVLSVHTLEKCRQEKIFPKSSRWIMAKPIMDECLAALTAIRRANAVYVGDDPISWRYRRSQQVEAHSHIDALMTLLDLAYNTFRIEPDQMAYWIRLTSETDDKLKAWMKSDKERYGHLSNIKS